MGREFGSAAALGVTHTGCCVGTNWFKEGLDSKLQIKPIQLGHGPPVRLTGFALFKNPQSGTLCSPDPLQVAPFRENTASLS